jgi:large subunit ribosomal protein L12
VKYVYAAMLLHSAGQPISEDSVKKVLGAAGAKVEEARIKALVAALSEVKIDEVLKNAATVAVAAPAAAPAAPSGPAQPKVEAKDDKKKEEEALAGLGALFG